MSKTKATASVKRRLEFKGKFQEAGSPFGCNGRMYPHPYLFEILNEDEPPKKEKPEDLLKHREENLNSVIAQAVGDLCPE